MLVVLASVVAALWGFSAAAFVAGLSGRVVRVGTAALAGAGAGAAVAGCMFGGAASIALPTLPIALTAALDPVSAFFLLPVLISAGAASACAGPVGLTPVWPLFVGALVATVLAGDGFTLLLGVGLVAVAGWALLPAGGRWFGAAAFGAACLVGAVGLLGPERGFTALRAAPPQGWRAAAALALVLLGAGPFAGLAPWKGAASHVDAVLSGGLAKVALYLVVRVVFDLCGPATPLWWAGPLLAIGATAALLGALRANQADDLAAVFSALTTQAAGTGAIGLGVALAARGADVAPLAALALGGTMLHALNTGLVAALLFLVAGAMQRGAGTSQLDRLGGLVRTMPVTAACALTGLASLAALPLTSGFAGQWMLFQAVFAAPRIGGLPVQIGCAAAALAMAFGTALAAAAALRVAGIACLGRPRTPRAAAAADGPGRVPLTALAGGCVLLGLAPGAVILLLDPAVHLLSGGSLAAGWLSVAALGEAPGYAPVGIATLLALSGGVAAAFVHRWVAGARRVPAWDDGFAAPPAWLPFGDPATQPTGAGFSQPILRLLDGWAPAITLPGKITIARPLAWLPPPTLRGGLVALFATLAGFLVLIAWLEAA